MNNLFPVSQSLRSLIHNEERGRNQRRPVAEKVQKKLQKKKVYFALLIIEFEFLSYFAIHQPVHPAIDMHAATFKHSLLSVDVHGCL